MTLDLVESHSYTIWDPAADCFINSCSSLNATVISKYIHFLCFMIYGTWKKSWHFSIMQHLLLWIISENGVNANVSVSLIYVLESYYIKNLYYQFLHIYHSGLLSIVHCIILQMIATDQQYCFNLSQLIQWSWQLKKKLAVAIILMIHHKKIFCFFNCSWFFVWNDRLPYTIPNVIVNLGEAIT